MVSDLPCLEDGVGYVGIQCLWGFRYDLRTNCSVFEVLRLNAQDVWCQEKKNVINIELYSVIFYFVLNIGMVCR